MLCLIKVGPATRRRVLCSHHGAPPACADLSGSAPLSPATPLSCKGKPRLPATGSSGVAGWRRRPQQAGRDSLQLLMADLGLSLLLPVSRGSWTHSARGGGPASDWQPRGGAKNPDSCRVYPFSYTTAGSGASA